MMVKAKYVAVFGAVTLVCGMSQAGSAGCDQGKVAVVDCWDNARVNLKDAFRAEMTGPEESRRVAEAIGAYIKCASEQPGAKTPPLRPGSLETTYGD